MRPAIVSGIVTGYVPVSYWPMSPLSFVSVPEVFAKVNLAQSPRFWSGEYFSGGVAFVGS